MAITYQCEDGIEPVSDSVGEQWGNIANYSVISGCAPTYSAANLTVDLAAGTIMHNGSLITVAVGASAWTIVVDSAQPRWTWLALSSAGAAVVVSGDPGAVPSVPELGDRVAIALIKVNAAATIANDITYKLDKRIFRPIFAGNGTMTTLVSTGALPVVNQFHHVSGSNTITSLPTFSAGVAVVLTFDGACPITHNATTLILVGGASITTTAGDTLVFVSEGSGNWRQIVAAAPPGMRLVGIDTTERTSTSTSAADGTAITLTTAIPVGQPFMISFSARKSAGFAAGCSIGLKVNSTIVYEAIAAPDFTTSLWTSGTTDEIQVGAYNGRVTPRDATYSVGNLQGQAQAFTATGGTERAASDPSPRLNTAVWPNATITTLTPRIIVGNAAVTGAYKNFMVWTYPIT